MSKLGNMNSETVSKCLKSLNLLGFIEQLEIKERCKLRYILSKSARHLLIDSNKLPEKPDGKEVKEVLRNNPKQINNKNKLFRINSNTVGLDEDGREIFMSNGKKCVKGPDGTIYNFSGDIRK